MTIKKNSRILSSGKNSNGKYPYTAGILAGGKSTRMGRDKAFLPWNGETFLTHSIRMLQGFSRILFSVPADSASRYESVLLQTSASWKSGRDCRTTCCEIVEDRRTGYGPLEGVYRLLCRMESISADAGETVDARAAGASKASEWLFLTAVDMPLLDEKIIDSYIRLCEQFLACNPSVRAIVPEAEGNMHPFCGFYHKSILHTVEELIRENRHSMHQLIKRVPTLILPLDAIGFDARFLANVNTPEEYRNFLNPPVLAVCGVKNSGKTTCLEKLIRILSGKGCKVAVIKHDGHDFVPDVPGTDSFRMQEAGAFGTAVFSAKRCAVYKRQETGPEELCREFQDCDIIFIEGMKNLPVPKVEIIRQGISDAPVSNPAGRLGILTDIPGFSSGGEKVWELNDMEKFAEFIANGFCM